MLRNNVDGIKRFAIACLISAVLFAILISIFLVGSGETEFSFIVAWISVATLVLFSSGILMVLFVYLFASGIGMLDRGISALYGKPALAEHHEKALAPSEDDPHYWPESL